MQESFAPLVALAEQVAQVRHCTGLTELCVMI